MEEIGIKKIGNQQVFRDIERTGERLKEQFRRLAERAQSEMNSKVQTTKLEAAYALTVPKEQRRKTMQEVKEVRGELWEEALKKADGDVNKAYIFYENLCDFP